MINRSARESLIAAIRDYLSEKFCAFEFDERLQKIADASKDQSVRWIVTALWFHYDDVKDHAVILSREEWNYFQRLLLILQSEAELITPCRLDWVPRLTAVAGLIAGFAFLIWDFGLGYYLFLVNVLLGLVFLGVRRILRRKWSTKVERENLQYPFATLAELRLVRRSVPSFRKQRYPSAIKDRRIRHPFAGTLMTALSLLVSPMWVLFALLPPISPNPQVVLPHHAA